MPYVQVMGYWKNTVNSPLMGSDGILNSDCSQSACCYLLFTVFQIVLHAFCSGFIVAIRGEKGVETHTTPITWSWAKHIYTYAPYECITYSKFSQIILKIKNTLCTTYGGCYTNRLCEYC